MEKKKSNHVSGLIRCPVCFEVTDECDPDECKRDCIAHCNQNAIVLKHRAKINLEKCTSCAKCVQVCPRNAIDKLKLFFDAGIKQLKCRGCGNEYVNSGRIFYLYPKKFDNQRFKQFYETFENKLDPWQEKVARTIKVKSILEVLPENKRKIDSLLDIGCSGGWVIDGLTSHFDFEYVTGLELSSSILEQVKEKIPYVSLIAADCEHLPFANSSYDLALAIDVIEHIQNPEKLLIEISRVANNAVLRIPLENVFENFIWNIIQSLREKLFFRHSEGGDFQQHINFFTKKSAVWLLEKSGLQIIRSCIPDNPFTTEYTSFCFAPPKKTMVDFEKLSLFKKIIIMSKFYLILSFRRIVFLILRPFYHKLCYSAFYVYCTARRGVNKE